MSCVYYVKYLLIFSFLSLLLTRLLITYTIHKWRKNMKHLPMTPNCCGVSLAVVPSPVSCANNPPLTKLPEAMDIFSLRIDPCLTAILSVYPLYAPLLRPLLAWLKTSAENWKRLLLFYNLKRKNEGGLGEEQFKLTHHSTFVLEIT